MSELTIETFLTRRKVLFGDCDASKFMYAPRLSHYIVESVGEFMDRAFGRPHVRYAFEINVSLPCRALTSEFTRPMTWDDEVNVHAWVGEIGTKSFSIDVMGVNDDGLEMFKGRLAYVCVSMETGQAMEIPEPWRNALES